MRQKTEHKLRNEIAQRAARLVAMNDARDFLTAKCKAATQSGVCEKKFLPSNIEIEKALVDYQHLFHGDSQHVHLLHLRHCAAESMHALRQFNPRLVGSVLKGTASQHSEITLHLFCDTPEDIGMHLINNGIPYVSCDHRIRSTQNKITSFPAYRFIAGQTRIVLIVFPGTQQHHAPLDPVDGKPMRRATEHEIRTLIKTMQTEFA
ncbi:MAG: hypothetical protein V3R68_06730 [Gammaproteobacteria bacterium]